MAAATAGGTGATGRTGAAPATTTARPWGEAGDVPRGVDASAYDLAIATGAHRVMPTVRAYASTFYPELEGAGVDVGADADGPRTNAAAIRASGAYRGNEAAARQLPAWDGDPGRFGQRAAMAGAMLFAASIAKSTQKNYRTGVRKFATFCFLAATNIVLLLSLAGAHREGAESVLEPLFLAFLGWLGHCRKANGEPLNPGSIAVYGYAASRMIVDLCGVRPSRFPRVADVLSSLKARSKRARGGRIGKSGGKKLPLVASLVQQIWHFAHWRAAGNDLMYAYACVLSLFFGFRVSELLETGQYKDDPDRQLRVGNILLYRQPRPGEQAAGDEIEVTRAELEDPAGVGDLEDRLTSVELVIGPNTKTKRQRRRRLYKTTAGVLCPVRTAFRVKMAAVEAGRGDEEMAFRAGNGRGRALKAGQGPAREGAKKGSGGSGYRLWLHRALEVGPPGQAGCYLRTSTGTERVDPYAYSTHSGRAGFATMLFMAGEDPLVVRDLGDWRSWACLEYRHDEADRFRGKSDIIANTTYVAPSAGTA